MESFTIQRRLARKFVALVAGMVVFVAYVSAQDKSETPEQQHAREVAASLRWMTDGAAQNIESVARLQAPSGYAMLNPDDTRKLMELLHNPTDSTAEYFWGPKSDKWFAVFSYEKTGYIKDDEKVDADAVLASIKAGTEASNKERQRRGWEPLTITGWQFPPRYDANTKRLEWAVAASSAGHTIVNYNTRILGREGVTKVILVSDSAVLNEAVAEFNQAITSFAYVDGERYDQFKAGDKVAEYGLAALIAGGAAAVATKTGFWKALVGVLVAGWKVVVAALLAVGAAARGLFKRKSQ